MQSIPGTCYHFKFSFRLLRGKRCYTQNAAGLLCFLRSSKNKTPVLGDIPVLGTKLKRGGRAYFGDFSAYTNFQPHQWTSLAEIFWMIRLKIDLSGKITKIRTIPLFFKVDLCSVTSMESFRREIQNQEPKYALPSFLLHTLNMYSFPQNRVLLTLRFQP